MAISKDVLLDAIESGFSLLPEVPGKIEWLKIPGVRARMMPLSHTHANMVSAATLNSDNADATIRRVKKSFSEQQKPFSWIVGPRTTPIDLGNRLAAAGFVKSMEMAGMSLTDLTIPIRTNPAVQIREATVDDMTAINNVTARGFPIPEDFAQLFTEILFLVRNELKTRMYLAFLDGIDEPVASCTTVYLPGKPIARMAGATTLEEYRGKGVYTSMTARRLADAHKDGIEAAVIEAKSTTSAPVCRKLGFTEICDLEMYIWTPKTTDCSG